MFEIFMYDIDGKKQLVYSPDKVPDGYAVISATVTNEVDKAGDASFTVAKTHPLYNSFRKIAARIEVRRNGKIIWYGRVYSIRRDFNMNKTITCEGALAFLEDICLMPFHYYEMQMIDGEMKKVLKKKTKYDYLTDIMGVYNSRCAAERKMSFSSNIIGELFMYNEIDGTSSYNTILSEIQDKIIEDYDYALIATYSDDEETGGVISCVNISRLPLYSGTQTIEFGKNLIDLEEFVNASDVYNCVVPVGSGNLSIFSDNGEDEESTFPIQSRGYWVTGAIGYEGEIDKVINFGNIDDRKQLYEAALTVLNLGGGTASTEFQINAVDLNLLDVDVDSIEIGQNIRVISKPHEIDEYFVCYKAEIDLLDPAGSKYTFRLPLPMSPETMTEHLCSTISDMSKKLNTKLTESKSYGVVNLSHDGSYFSVSKEQEKPEEDEEEEVDEYGKVKIPITQPIKDLSMIQAKDAEMFLDKPDKIVRVSDNEVQAFYGSYKQTITAEGAGDERYNFISKIEKVTV